MNEIIGFWVLKEHVIDQRKVTALIVRSESVSHLLVRPALSEQVSGGFHAGTAPLGRVGYCCMNYLSA